MSHESGNTAYARPGTMGSSASAIPTRTQLQRGITLLEALLAFAILSLAILGLMRSQMAMQAHQHLARDITRATILAESEIERLQALPWTELPPDGKATILDTSPPSSGTAFTVTREVETTSSTLRRITLHVQWSDLSGTPHDLRWESARSFEPQGWGAQKLAIPAAEAMP
jgi:Tfp pilus assembly protein PilV